MRFTLPAAVLTAATLVAIGGCSQQPREGTPAANADAVADQLEAKANNYAMMADNTTDSDAALALENAAGTLDERSANVREEAHPKQGVK